MCARLRPAHACEEREHEDQDGVGTLAPILASHLESRCREAEARRDCSYIQMYNLQQNAHYIRKVISYIRGLMVMNKSEPSVSSVK